MIAIEDISSIPPENIIIVPAEMLTPDGGLARCGEGENFCWFDRLSDEQKDAVLDYMLECIAARNSKLLDVQDSHNLIAEIARSGAPHAGAIFLRHAQKGSGADLADALRKCFAQRDGRPITVSKLIHAARACGANLEPWRRPVLDAMRLPSKQPLKADAPEALESQLQPGGGGILEPDRTAPEPEQERDNVVLPFSAKNYLNARVDLKTLSIPLIKFSGLKHTEPEQEFICTGLPELVAEIAPDPTPMIWYKKSVPYYIAGTLKAAEFVGQTRERALREGRATFGKQRSNSHIASLGPAILLDDDGDVFAREPRLRALGAAAIIYSSHSYGFKKDGATKPAKGGRVVSVLDRSVTPDEYRAARDGLEHLCGGGFDENASSISHCYGRHVRRSKDAPYKRVIIDGAAFNADALIELGRSLRPQRQDDSPEARKTPQGHERALAAELERIKLMGAVRPLNDYTEWMSSAGACKRAFSDDEEAAFTCFDTLSACSPPKIYKDADAARKKFDQVSLEYDGDKIPVTLDILHARAKRRAIEVIRTLYSPQLDPSPKLAQLDPDQDYLGAGIDGDGVYPKGGEPIPPGTLKPEDGIDALEYILFSWSEKTLEGLHVPPRDLEEARRRTGERRKSLDLDGGPQSSGDAADNAEISRLAKLSLFDYDRERKAAAERLGVRAPTLDLVVRNEQARLGLDAGDDGLQGTAVTCEDIDPWPEPVDGVELLNELATTIRSHVVMSDYERDICALWTLHSYLIKHFKISPKLSIKSVVKQCGKTTLLEALSYLVYRPWMTGSITVAALFRVIEMWHPTLLIDEVDTFVGDNEELRGILNQSHRYDGYVTRTVGEDHEPRRFSVYTPIALSGIGGLADTLADRSVTTVLKRRRPNEPITQLRIGRMEHLDDLRRRIVRWVADHEHHIATRDPVMPARIINRDADNWHVLLAIADEGAGDWPTRARKAAEQHQIAVVGDDASRLELLLGDIRDVFDGLVTDKDRISSAHLIERLVEIVPRPWAEYGRTGKPLTQNGLARLLRPLRIAPEQIRFDTGENCKGYHRHTFEET